MHYGPETFNVRLESADGMEPEFRAGDYVYVDPDLSAEHGHTVAVLRPGGEMTVRRFVIEDGRRVLRALDADAQDCVLDELNETILQGVVVFRGRRV